MLVVVCVYVREVTLHYLKWLVGINCKKQRPQTRTLRYTMR